MSLYAPYLDAIQALPGDTPGEKFRWIAKEIKKRASTTENLEEIVEYDKFPRALAPLIQVEAARLQIKAIKKGERKENKKSLANYEAIAEALKSEDSEVVNRGLRVSEFFNGNNQTITNTTFFLDELIPNVSLKTRHKIIKALAFGLVKNPSLAEEFFTKVFSIYGVEQAFPLLPACREDFIYDTVVKNNICLPIRIIKLMYLKSPDFVVRYLKLLSPNSEFKQHQHRGCSIFDYTEVLAKLVKRRLEDFVEIYEMHEDFPPQLQLTNASTAFFWKHGKDYLDKKPRLYIKLLPLKIIDEARMENIFPKLLPDKQQDFSTENALSYLEFYPEEKKSSLLLESYKKVYGKDIFEESDNITPALMRLLPEEERVKQARRMIAEAKGDTYFMDYTKIWRCYLRTSETIPEIKEEIAKTSQMENRAALLCQMFYTCTVNQDDAALLETLKYWRDRHKNEQSWLTLRVIQCLLKEFDLPKWNETLWSVLLDVIGRLYIQNNLTALNVTSTDILAAALRHKLMNNMPIDQLIDMLVDCKLKGYSRMWNILEDNAEYERKCLEACLEVICKNRDSQKEPWKDDRSHIILYSIESIYVYNERHVKKKLLPKEPKVEPLSIKNYPWLLKDMDKIITENDSDNSYIIRCLQTILLKHEQDLYNQYWPQTQKKVADVQLGEALKLLRKMPESILENWQDYLKQSCDFWRSRQTQRFLKATRWYKDIPIKFAEDCSQQIKRDKCPKSIPVLALLLHGNSFTKFIEPLIPTEHTIDIDDEDAKIDFALTESIISSFKYSNPPIPLELLGRLCVEDYLSFGLTALVNVCRRTSLPKVMLFAKILAGKRVSARKHGIRIIHMVGSIEETYKFLLSLWKTENHYSIRQVIFDKAYDLFEKNPSPVTWSVLEEILMGIRTIDKEIMNQIQNIIRQTPNDYVEKIVKLIFAVINHLAEEGLETDTVTVYTENLIRSFNRDTCKFLQEEFIMDLLTKHLFHGETRISDALMEFVTNTYLHPDEEKLEERLRIVSKIFVTIVKAEWNVPHPEKPRYFPVNYMVHKLITDLISSGKYGRPQKGKVFQVFLESYNQVLKPEMDSMSYLLLVFATEKHKANTVKEFGENLANKVIKLLEEFSTYFIGPMSNILEYFLDVFTFEDSDIAEVKLSIMEAFYQVGTVEALFFCGKMLTPNLSKQYFDRHNAIIVGLSKSQHPAIKSLLYNFINSTNIASF